jgi:hypothetical protein
MIIRTFGKILISLVVFILMVVSLSSVSVLAQSTKSRELIPGKQTICGGKCPLVDTDFAFTKENIASFILSIARFLTYISAALAVLFIVYGAFLIVVDDGSGTRSGKGWKTIRSSIIGLILVIVAYTVVYFIGNLLQGNVLENIGI